MTREERALLLLHTETIRSIKLTINILLLRVVHHEKMEKQIRKAARKAKTK